MGTDPPIHYPMRTVGRSAPSVQLQTNAVDAGLRCEILCTGSPVGGVVRKRPLCGYTAIVLARASV